MSKTNIFLQKSLYGTRVRRGNLTSAFFGRPNFSNTATR